MMHRLWLNTDSGEYPQRLRYVAKPGAKRCVHGIDHEFYCPLCDEEGYREGQDSAL